MKKVQLKIFVMTAPGIESLLAAELTALRIRITDQTAGGISFSGSTDHLQRVNLWSRLANRVLVRVAEFHASSFHELERRAKKIEWASFTSPGDRVRFRVTCRKSKLYHSDAVAARLLQASGGVAAATDESDEGDDDAQLFVVRLSHDECTISADSSGELLHRRGYRHATAKAPLRETLAAAMLAGSGWDPSAPLVDPMCGAGTIPIEAAMIARGIAPGATRRFSFERWPDHDSAGWKKTVDDARDAALPRVPGPIIASDRDAGAIEATAANAGRAGVTGDLEISETSVSGASYPQPPGWIVTNPPYGLRVGETGPLRNLYSQLGHIVREGAPGYRLAMLSADKALESQLRLETDEVFRTTNGGIPIRLILA
ncbi:MAG: THUMP domain-containing class I SAM-dependent RNA methyltransferase [Gemmatimonadaceae bacterium]